ncbi:phage regulatory CII family protein [Hydrogenovibrio sp. 3SP14C1]|uniref:phage regulatory CII family protein n=1 Tax=Hydrogenovibrio sp. 3SP14C1 TaxID=3038774 RepID=UPI00241776FB|nr:phage regulatory CII family protein [Hydrogenovibrio sp. 3SP14C1]MDG4811911.1 phage regulatory CII family protein [Hydrogenovibrio sp. 3SP14C1]
MDTLLNAIHKTVPYGHAAKLADKIGMSQKILSNKVNPDNEHHQLTVLELCRLMPAADDYQVLIVMADMFGFKIEKKQPSTVKNIISALLTVESEHGDVSRTLGEALEDGRLTRDERTAILREVNEAIDSLHGLKESVHGSKV